MTTYRFPEQKTALSNKALTRENIALIFEEIFRVSERSFTGYLKITAESGTLYFLFILQSDPYAAGIYTGIKPFSLTISDFFTEIFAPRSGQLTLSLHETDPVLLKSMLVFLQDEPTVKAPINLIDLEQITRQVREEAGDALVVLEKELMFNFFFFKGGKAAISHLADRSWTPPAGLSIDEQMLLYAFEPSATPVSAYVYRNIATEQAADAVQISRQKFLEMVRGPMHLADKTTIGTAKKQRQVILEVMAGAEKGKCFSVSLPCCIGRQECDLVINDALVSRRHALLEETDGQLRLVDQGSTNGTFANGERIKSVILSPDDIFTIGETSLKIAG